MKRSRDAVQLNLRSHSGKLLFFYFFLPKGARCSWLHPIGRADNSVRPLNNEITHQWHGTKEPENSKRLHNSALTQSTSSCLISSRNRENAG